MHPDDPLAGVGPPPLDASGSPFCPICGLDLRGGVCPACDPGRRTTPAARAARKRAQETAAVRAVARRWMHEPVLWLLVAVLVAVQPAATVGLGLLVGYAGLWTWVVGVADRYPPGAPERDHAGKVAITVTVASLFVLLLVAFAIGQAKLGRYGY